MPDGLAQPGCFLFRLLGVMAPTAATSTIITRKNDRRSQCRPRNRTFCFSTNQSRIAQRQGIIKTLAARTPFVILDSNLGRPCLSRILPAGNPGAAEGMRG